MTLPRLEMLNSPSEWLAATYQAFSQVVNLNAEELLPLKRPY